ncbi:MAG: hypothetical protein JNM00_11165, partial [Flavobacteriales bacterium]|nr:hypothetical protein [Flavobacteriales bacterium]
MIRVAVVDCGTNTFNLLIAEADAGGWKKIFRSKLPVKLGAGGFAAGNITSSRFIRGIDALYCHHQNIINFDCRHTIAVGTSALREATNAKEFLTYAQRVARLDVEVISGEREASLIYKGVTQTITPSEIPVLVMDIGGGSTEFIIGNKDGILWSKSFLLGVSRLQEMLTPSERFSHRDASQIRQALGAALPELNAALKEFQPAVLIGSSGSFDTLLSLYRYNKKMTEPVALANEIPMSELPAI